MNWSQFQAAAPDLASFGEQRLEGRIAYLATIRPDGSPRVHPVSPFIAGDYLFVYMEPTSPKAHDLRRDARYALHGGVEDNSGGQGEMRTRKAAFRQARLKGYEPKEKYIVFELRIEEAMGTLYEEDGPKRTRWKTNQV